MEHHFFAMISRMKYIERWALMRNSMSENLCEHSLEVGMLAHALATIGNLRHGKNLNAERAALIGMYHDATEILTGDMPTPIKYYNRDIQDAFKGIEQNAARKLLEMLPEDLRADYKGIFFLGGQESFLPNEEGDCLRKKEKNFLQKEEGGLLLNKEGDCLRKEEGSFAREQEGAAKEWYLWRLVKAADKLSALIKCIEEEKAGNSEFKKAKESIMTSLESMMLPEVEDFMREFLPSYHRTLDELQ